MILDVKTLLAVYAVTHVLQALGLMYVRRIHHNYFPTLLWAVGSAVVAVGVILAAFRGFFPLNLSIIGGQAFIFSGWIVFNNGIIVACGQRPPWRWGGGLLLSVMSFQIYFSLIDPDIKVRLIVFSLGVTLCNAWAIWAAVRHPAGPLKTSLSILAGLQIIEVVTVCVRSYYLVSSGAEQVFQNNGIEISFTLSLICTTFLMAFVLATITSQRLQIELLHQSRHDSLTGLHNRRAFAELADREWPRILRRNEPAAMLMMDIDHFKGLNDRFGHQAGDEVLKVVAAAIGRELRGEDILCRFGGEEFAVLLLDASPHQAVVSAERFRTAVAELHVPIIADYPLTISIGAAIKTADTAHWEDLITSADIALYQAKHEGRNRVCLYRTSQPLGLE